MEAFYEIVKKYSELIGSKYSIFASQIDDHNLNIIQSYANIINFLKIDFLEKEYANLYENIQNCDTNFLSEILSNLNEKSIIKYFKIFYKDNNINLKTNRRSPITIQTVRHKVTIQRYLLSPVTSQDANNLWNLEKTRSVYPLDRAIGISELPFKMTVGAMLKVSEVAQDSKSFKHAASRLKTDWRMTIDAKTIMEVTSHIGSIAFEHELQNAEKIYKDVITNHNWSKFSQKKNEGILYILVDGAMVNTRKEEETTDSGWKENKLGLVYNSKNVRITGNKDKQGDNSKNRHEIITKEYTAYIGNVNVFQVLLFGCAIKNGYGEYKQTVLLSDGATWIRNMKNEYFYGAQQILDLYHLKEKIWNFAKLYFKDDKSKYTPWSNIICDKIEKSQHDYVLKEVIKMENKIHLIKDRLSTYITNNIDCIDYAAYTAKGYDVGSGAIESSNKTVLQYRLKQPGMRWNLTNAQNMVTLRAKMESGKWWSDVVMPVKKKYKINI
jgi:hypothetical protein